eukprot:TRINITY_DN14003_c0_g1_i2.p1 TRINITY_DN14003_c0_g1~~TRINITY_DN14003_c0_g1_i2.p1  ORF type:complete len:763 (+),score=73.62 TRINITY_DN14003_c0_g1_i2:32-2320(+)
MRCIILLCLAVVAAAQCDKQWTYDGRGKCVRIAPSGSWGPAPCERLKSGSILARVDDQAAQKALGAFIDKSGKVWTGLNTLIPLRAAWKWTDGLPYIWSGSNNPNPQLPNFNLWAPFRPTPNGGDCAYVGGTCSHATAYLCEAQCTQTHFSLCSYKPKPTCDPGWTYNKNSFLCLRVTITKQTFGDDPCKTLEPTATLASILSEDEATYVHDNMPITDELWVGLTRKNPDPPVWEWADGTTANQFTGMWEMNRPDNSGACAYITGSGVAECSPNSGSMCDGMCQEKYPHLCEYDYVGAPFEVRIPAEAPAQAPVEAPSAKAQAPVAEAPSAQSRVTRTVTVTMSVFETQEVTTTVITPSDQSPADTPSKQDDDSSPLIPILLVVIGLLLCCILHLLLFVARKNREKQKQDTLCEEMDEQLLPYDEDEDVCNAESGWETGNAGTGVARKVEGATPVDTTLQPQPVVSKSKRSKEKVDVVTPKGSPETPGNETERLAGLIGTAGLAGLGVTAIQVQQNRERAAGNKATAPITDVESEAAMGSEVSISDDAMGKDERDATSALDAASALDTVGEALSRYADHVFRKDEMVRVRNKGGNWKVGAVVFSKKKGKKITTKVELSDGTTKVWHETEPTGECVLVRDNDDNDYVRGVLASDYGLFYVKTTTGAHRWLDIIPNEADDGMPSPEPVYQYGQSVYVRMEDEEWQCGTVVDFAPNGLPQVSVPGMDGQEWHEVSLHAGKASDELSMGTEPDEYDDFGMAGRRAI